LKKKVIVRAPMNLANATEMAATDPQIRAKRRINCVDYSRTFDRRGRSF